MPEFISDILQFLLDVVLFIPKQVFKWWTEAMVYMINLVPAPFTSADVTSALNGVGGDVLYFLTVFEFGYGLTAIFTAYGARFLLRRIPGIG